MMSQKTRGPPPLCSLVKPASVSTSWWLLVASWKGARGGQA